MDDRELLELAAKAAGVAGKYEPNFGIMSPAWPWAWNPLTDDGDALRLAVKLGMTLRLSPEGYAVAQHQLASYVEERNALDANAATRRAIVRAAAEIGRSMNSRSE